MAQFKNNPALAAKLSNGINAALNYAIFTEFNHVWPFQFMRKRYATKAKSIHDRAHMACLPKFWIA
ncbi:hypothetical protein MAH4_08570 [Sessilibacter sp. MAH4]